MKLIITEKFNSQNFCIKGTNSVPCNKCETYKSFPKGYVFTPSYNPNLIVPTRFHLLSINNCYYGIPKSIVKELKDYQGMNEEISELGFIGEEKFSKQSDTTKNVIAIVAILSIIIVAILLLKGKLFKSLN